MSKTYEALLRAEKEQATKSKGALISKAAIAKRIKKSKRKTKRAKDPLRHDIHQERLVGRLPICHLIPDPESVLAEQFRKLKSLLATSIMVDSIQSVLLTSCLPGEGKTFVSLNLSATVARRFDGSAILIDADLRRKGLTYRLGLQKGLGLSDLLSQKANLHDTLVTTDIENLLILPAGLSSSNPGDLVTSPRMNTLIQELRASHESSFIIIDSTPIAATSEVNALSRMTDRVILVIMADKTRSDVVKRELKTIASDQILGVVLNCAEFETTDYYGRYYK
jgi:capsular exopolysaccharide synthesis family protein